jgi:uncharacterized beta-barrel protein YwiB (DUF1934 family)
MNDAIIRICGLQVIEDTGESIETMARGKHYIKNEKHYVLYDEINDDDKTKIKNTIKFNEEHVEVTRKGSMNGKLIFSKGQNNQSLYSTPFGDLLIEINTKDIELTSDDASTNLKIDYELYVNNDKVSDSKIELNVSDN